MADDFPRIDLLSDDPLAIARRKSFHGMMFPQETVIAASTVICDTHKTVWIDTNNGDVEITLPDPATNFGVSFTLKKINTNGGQCSINAVIDDRTEYILDDYTSITVMSIGTQYMITSSYHPTF